MLAEATNPPSLPLVIGIPFALMFVTGLIIAAIYWGLGRLGNNR